MSYVSGLFFLDGQMSDLLDSVFQGLSQQLSSLTMIIFTI